MLGWLLCGLVAWSTSAAVAAAAAQPDRWRVAIVVGYDPFLPALQVHQKAMREALLQRAPGGADFFTDTIDSPRFDSIAGANADFLALMRTKFRDQRVDLVVGIGDPSADFIRRHRSEIWGDAPVLLAALDLQETPDSRPTPGTVPSGWSLDMEGTLAIIRRLQPEATRLVIVGGVGAFDLQLVERAAVQAQPNWRTERWTQLSSQELHQQLAALDPATAVLYTTRFRSADGTATFPADALAQMESHSAVPIYGLYSTYVGRGIVAGSVIDLAAQGAELGLQAAAVLAGEGPGATVTVPPASARCMADASRMQRHGLDLDALPPGCEIRNRPRSIWSEYRAYVLGTLVILALQGLTIAGLLVQRRSRRKAEAESRRKGADLARAMRITAMGELSASIAHEINQPLAAILTNVDACELQLRTGAASLESVREILADIRRDDLRAHSVIRRLRSLLEKHETQHMLLAFHTVLLEVLPLLDAEARSRGARVQVRFDATDDRIHGDGIELQQVLVNLTLNGLDAMAQTPPDLRELDITTEDVEDGLRWRVLDRGCGFGSIDPEQMFKSFYTTKDKGIGLGLPIVKAIVESHGGRVVASLREGGGACFEVVLPRPGAAAADHLPPSTELRKVPT